MVGIGFLGLLFRWQIRGRGIDGARFKTCWPAYFSCALACQQLSLSFAS